MKKYSLLLLPILAILAFGCKKDKTEAENPIQIGKFYAGGYIFHIYSDGQHGMVLAPPSVERDIPWGCSNTVLGLTSPQYSVFGSGAGNTYFITQICQDGNSAAKFCADLALNGFDDWFLPSIDELDSALAKLRVNPAADLKIDLFYWSSTEGPNGGVYSYSNSSLPAQRRKFNTNKATSPGVLLRPVRIF
jgi:hypothetical protein